MGSLAPRQSDHEYVVHVGSVIYFVGVHDRPAIDAATVKDALGDYAG